MEYHRLRDIREELLKSKIIKNEDEINDKYETNWVIFLKS